MPGRSEQELRGHLATAAIPALLTGASFSVGLLLYAETGSRAAATAVLRGWLVGWLAWVILTIGSLGLLMLSNLVRGYWARPFIRVFEAACSGRTLAVMAVGFLPIAFGAGEIYPWAKPLEATWYLSQPFFIARAAVYFAVWATFAVLLRRSLLRTGPGEAERADFRSRISAPGIPILFLTASFAVVDWMMSLEPDWNSSIYGLLFVIVSALSALGYALFFVRTRAEDEPYRSLLSPGLTKDVGNLLLVILLLWAYFSYSQYIVMWSGDITDEVRYFTIRNGGWDVLAEAIIVLGFFGPLLALITPLTKATIKLLGALGGWLLVIAWAHLFWMLGAPLMRTAAMPEFGWTVVAAFLAVGGFWRWSFLATLAEAPLAPMESESGRTGKHVAA